MIDADGTTSISLVNRNVFCLSIELRASAMESPSIKQRSDSSHAVDDNDANAASVDSVNKVNIIVASRNNGSSKVESKECLFDIVLMKFAQRLLC